MFFNKQRERASLLRLWSIMALAFILSGCSKTSMLQSPSANTTQGVDMINATLDEAIAAGNDPVEVPDEVIAALTPPLLQSTTRYEVEERFDVAVVDLAARDFFQALVEGTDRNIVIHPEVEGTISLSLKNVTVPEVMDITKEIYGYDYEMNNNLIKVFSSGLRTEIFYIDYLNVRRSGESGIRVSAGQIVDSDGGSSSSTDSDSDSSSNNSSNRSGSSALSTKITTASENDFWSNLQETLSLIIGEDPDSKVIITPGTGVVVVKAESDALSNVRRYLENAELILQRQVILEAKILEVELSEGYQQGIDWTFQDSSRNLASDGLPEHFVNLDNMAEALDLGDIGGVFATTARINDFNIVLELLGTQGNVQVLSSPRISTVNNQKAVIKVGSDEYFITDIDLVADAGADTTSTDVEFTPFFSGIALDVTPQIGEDRDIILHVHPTISRVEDQTKRIQLGTQEFTVPLASSSVRESDSIISARDGQIVVIGGLIQTRNVDDNASVPVLGDIPLLGELFKQKRQQTVRSELVILLRPMITDDQTFAQDIAQTRERFGSLRDILAAPPETSFE